MTEKEASAMKYDLLHNLGQALRDTQAHTSPRAGAVCASIPGGEAQTPPARTLRAWLHADSIATPGHW